MALASEDDKLDLLNAVISGPGRRSTQRHVARILGITKVEARRRLKAAVTEGLVEERLEQTSAAPGRRVFWLSRDRGERELDRLKRVGRVRDVRGGEPPRRSS